jgi:UDP-N-acetylmuramate: L-alanyl-gamma-D-glutamyl-meso-diaminopimelate ligase
MKRAHFIGICGVGMSATAMLLKEKGWEVSGSDSGCFDPIKSYLTEHHIPFVEGYSSANIPPDTDLVVGGGSAKLADNEEIVAARERGLEVKTFPEVIADISRDQETVLVVGSYGKSTMSSLVARCLLEAGKDPSWFTGAPPVGGGLASHLGKGRFFVAEADEYPTSGIDKRSKFLHFKADNVILIAGEHDHVNVFPTPESYRAPFIELLSKVPTDGSIIACVDNPGVTELVAPHLGKTITYGLDPANHPEWSGGSIERGETTRAVIIRNGEAVCTITTTLLGDHNIQNIIGAAAFLIGRDILTPEEFSRCISAFKGIKRRLEKKTENASVPVYEGYGSSVDKARAAIKAIKAHFPSRRLVIVFEPHTFSWRNRAMLWWYDDIFKDAALTLVYHPASIGAGSHDQATHEEIMHRINASGAKALPISTSDECLALLEKEAVADDIILILTSGPMDGLVDAIPKMIEEKFPA